MEISRTSLEQAKTIFTYGADNHFEEPADVIVDVFVNAIVEGTPELTVNAATFLEGNLVSEIPEMRDRALVVYRRLNDERSKNEKVVDTVLISARERLNVESVYAEQMHAALEGMRERLKKFLR
jgi:hypothetical protein